MNTRIFSLILALGIAVGMIGCGGGNSGSGSNPPTTTYTVSATAGTGTTITPASTTVVAGSTATFTVGLLSGYQNLVAVGCTISGTSCTTGAINSNTSVSVSATPIPTYTVSATAGTGTTITPASTTVVAGSTATFTVGLLSGYQNLVAVGCTISGTSCTTGAINSNTSVSVSATPIPTYTVSATAGTGTTITPASTTVVAGSTATFTVGLLSGYQNLVAVGCTISGTSCTTGAINSNTSVSVSATVISTAYSLVWAYASPDVVFDSDYANAQITIWVSASGNLASLEAIPDQAIAGSGTNPITLNDTLTANGGEIYSATITPGVPSPTFHYLGKVADSLGFAILAKDANGNFLQSASNISAHLEVGIVTKPKQPITITQIAIANGVYVTPNAVNVVQPYSGPLDILSLTNQIYTLFPGDLFDTIVVSSSRVDAPRTPGHVDTQNSILGIGSGAGGDASISTAVVNAYGSSGRLTGVTQEDPDDITHKAFLHEDGHEDAFLLNNPQLDLTAGNGAHQDALCTSVGWLGSNQYLVQQPDGDFVITSKGDGKYSDLELYLRGFEPASSVADLYCLLNYSWGTTIPVPGTIVPFSAVTKVTMSDIIAIYGQRSPDYTAASQSERALFVFVLEAPPTQAEAVLHDNIASYYASASACVEDTSVFPPVPCPFNAATNGHATLTVAVPTK